MRNKKLGNLIMFIAFSGTLFSCRSKATYSITFKQQGVADIVKTVKSGEILADIPTPKSIYGYSTSWDVTNFSNINSDIVVNAISTANTYVLTYNAPGYAIDGTKVLATFDSVCSNLNMSLTKENAEFLGWTYGSKIYNNESVWDVANNVTLSATWDDFNNVTVTFVNLDGSTITKTVKNNEDLTDIPVPQGKTGYVVSWDRTDFTNLESDISVNAVATPKTYQVRLDSNGGTVNNDSFNVTFNDDYTIETPHHNDLEFLGWKYNEQFISQSGKWNIDSNDQIILVAEWSENIWTDIL
mgnify:CR=1 FL=1